MTKSKLERRVEEYGEGWSIETIDMERVAYRKLGDYYDVEVSGIYGRSNICSVFIWETPKGLRPKIAARRFDVSQEDVPKIVEEMKREIDEAGNGR